MKDNLNQPFIISITGGTVLKAVVICFLAYLLYLIRDFVLVLLASIVIASAIEPGKKFFMKYKVPRILSVIFVYAIVVGILIGIVYIFLPALIADFGNFTASFPAYVQSLNELGRFNSIPGFNSVIQGGMERISDPNFIAQIGQTLTGATYGFLSIASTIFGGIASFFLIIILSFYFAVQEDGVASFLRIVVPNQHEEYIVGLWKRSQEKIGRWMQGQLLLGVIIGILTYLALSILGVPNPMLLAVIAAVCELIPIFGPLIAAIPAVIFALIDGGATLAALTAGLYLIIQQFENHLIHPLVVKKMVGIPSIIAIIALIIGAKIAGFLGIILSVPVAAGIMEFLNDIDRSKHPRVQK